MAAQVPRDRRGHRARGPSRARARATVATTRDAAGPSQRQRCRKCLDLLGAATYAERANAATASMRSGDTESATERRRTSDVDRGPCLFLVAQGHRPQQPPLRLPLSHCDRIAVGRTETLDLVTWRGRRLSIDLGIPDPKVSAKHARFEHYLGRWAVTDSASKNGTFVNGDRVEQAALSDGDTIDVGDTMFVFRDDIAQGDAVSYRPPSSSLRGLSSVLPAIQAEFDALARMAQSSRTLLVQGETGTGKELVARAVHDLSGRAGDLIPVNCGGLPSDRIEAELFGWKRGAFTGATADHKGLVRAADGGTLFLDEIGDLPLADQATLLRVLQEHEVLPIAETRAVVVDLRVVAATHRPLDVLVSSGAFRHDLLARLSGYRVCLKPLRERREDVGIFLADMLGKRGRDDDYRLTIGALRALLQHDWPMNIRELNNAIEQALLTCADGVIDIEDLSPLLASESAALPPRPAGASPEDALREQLISMLREHQGNIAAVARAMGKARMQIQRWIKRYGLTLDEFRATTRPTK